LNIYPGALSAISLQGSAHYIRLGRENLYIFTPTNIVLPKWFKNHQWKENVICHSSNFLPEKLGMNEYKVRDFEIKISSLERAILECLYLAPKKLDLIECYQIIEGLTTLSPTILQELLEGCTSIKVKRLFLYMAEKANHAWFKYLNKEKLDLGKGDRNVVKGGIYIAKYKITVPRGLSEL
jgi:hypothetical protein